MKTVPLGEIATIERLGVDPTQVDPATRYIGLEHIERGGRIAATETVSSAGIKSTKFQFTPSHMLFGKLRPNLGKIARPASAGVCSTDILPVLPGPELSRDYLFHYLSQPRMIDFAASQASGANLPRLSPKALADFIIPLPPLDEQRRIAAILDHADGLQSKRQSVIKYTTALERSIFIDMFGDPVQNPRGLPIAKLDEVGELDRGVSRHRPRNDPALLGGPYPLIQTGDVARSGGQITAHSATYSELGLAQSKLWPTGTLCITIAANIAQTGVLTFPACFPDSVVGFAADKATTTYVRVWLNFLQPTLEATAPQSAQRNINLAILRALPIPMPEPDKIQLFDEAVDRVQQQQCRNLKARAEDGELFVSLQSRAFAGQL